MLATLWPTKTIYYSIIAACHVADTPDSLTQQVDLVRQQSDGGTENSQKSIVV